MRDKFLKVFYDSEFTGLSKDTSLISVGFVTENLNDEGKSKAFYGEFTDYNESQINPWLQENIIGNLFLDKTPDVRDEKMKPLIENWGITNLIHTRGDSDKIRKDLKIWLSDISSESGKQVIIISDVLSYDWMLFVDLMATYTDGYPNLPKSVYYLPIDIASTLFECGIDPDINREEFAQGILRKGITSQESIKHNSLWDCLICKTVYKKLQRITNNAR